jgi:hypothetical protein
MGRPRKYPEGWKEHVKIKIKPALNVPGYGPTRAGYLKKYHDPETLALDAENQAARLRGYDDDGIRQLMAAISLQAILDYKKACTRGKAIKGRSATDMKQECDAFFKDEFFQYFVNGMKLEEIHEWIDKLEKDNYHFGDVKWKNVGCRDEDEEDIEDLFYERTVTTKKHAKGKNGSDRSWLSDDFQPRVEHKTRY